MPYPHIAGREATITGALAALERHHVVALCGLPGVGKSQVAAHVASRAATALPFVAWLRGDRPSLDEDARGLLLALGEEAADERPLQRIRSWLADHTGCLLVLDGVAGPDAVHELLSEGLAGQILATTTDSSWQEPGWPCPIEPLAPGVATAFLRDQSGGNDALDRRAAEALGRRLGGLPLALRQCVGFVAVAGLTLRRYLELFDGSAARLLREGSGPVDHRLTVAVTFDLAVGQAEAKARGARDLLRLLSFLAADPLDRAILQADDARDEVDLVGRLSALHAVSLIELQGDQLAVHGLVAEVVRGTLTAAALRRWATEARDLLLAALPRDAQEPSGWPLYGAVVGHLEAVSDHLVTLKCFDGQTARLLDQLATYAQARGRYGEARRRFEQAMEAVKSLPQADELRLGVLGNYALLLAMMHSDEALPLLEEVVARHRANPECAPEVLADALNNLGYQLTRTDPDSSIALLKEALELYSDAFDEAEWPDRLNVLNGLTNLALAMLRAGDLKGAEEEWTRCLGLMRRSRLDRRPDIATVMGNIGVVHDHRGDGAEAVRWQTQAYDLSTEVYGENHPKSINALVNLGGARRVAAEGGRDRASAERALEDHQEAERRAADLQPPGDALIASALNNQGLDLLALGEPVVALIALDRALDLRSKLAGDEPTLDIAQTLGNIGRALVDAERFEEADDRFTQVLDLADELGLGPGSERRALAFDGQGDIALRRGQFARAVEHFERSHQAFVLNAGADSHRARRAAAKVEKARRRLAAEA